MSKKTRFVLIILFILLMNTACNDEDRLDYQEAYQSADMPSYNYYLLKHPNGHYVDQIESLKEKYYYQKVKEMNTPEMYDQFIKKYPSSPYTAEIRTLKEKYFFKHAKQKNTIEALENFLQQFPNGVYTAKATSIYESLCYKKALSVDTISEYKKFLQKFSNSQHKVTIQERIALLRDVNNLADKVSDTSDPNSLLMLEKSLQNSANNQTKRQIEKKIIDILETATKIIETNKIEISHVTNLQNLQKNFSSTVKTDIFFYMSGEKIDNKGLQEALTSRQWYDFGVLKNQETNQSVITPDSGIPLGGEYTNMLDAQFVSLPSGKYTLYYKTDSGRAWNDFGENPPFNEYWGVSLYFPEYAVDIWPILNTLIKNYKNSKFYNQYKKLAKVTFIKAKQCILDKHNVKIHIGNTLSQLDNTSDIDRIEEFLTSNPENIWTPIIKYALYNKKLHRMYKDIKISQIEINDAPIVASQVPWLAQALEDNGIAATYTDAESAADMIRSGSGTYFTRIKAKQYYITGYVENSSNQTVYNLDVRCDMHIKGVTEGGIWYFRTKHESNKIRSLHYKLKNLQPGEKRPFVFKVKTDSGGAINFGLFGGSTSKFIAKWESNIHLLKPKYISSDILLKQSNLLEEAGMDKIDFNAHNIKPAEISTEMPNQRETLNINF